MARITKAQKAGMDLLDQIFFSELVVHHGMDPEERRQICTIIRCATEMAESKYSGREAEIIKHLVYYFLEVTLVSPSDELKKAIPVEVPALDLSKETIDAIDSHAITYQMAFMLGITKVSTGFDASYALEIFELLKDEFVGCSALVRRDLVRRCFVCEWTDASLRSYCWLTVSGVLPVTKNGPDRINSNISAEFMMRLALLAEYEMITHHLKVTLGKSSFASVILDNSTSGLKETAIDRLLESLKIFNESSTKPSLHGIPVLNHYDSTSTERIQEFFEQWGRRKSRLRMHSGTLASWLGFLGAGMIQMQLTRERLDADQEKFRSGAESIRMSDLKVSAIFNACDNKGTISDVVNQKLSKYGLQINSDTMYRNHSMMKKTVLPLLDVYCELTRSVGVVMSALDDDVLYLSLFTKADNMRNRSRD